MCGMSDELILDFKDEKRYAPSINTTAPIEVDEEFAKELNQIPDKMAFKIGDVAEIVDVKPYVLRYWETEFKIIKPQKSKHNQRIYTRRDVEAILMIKKLLYKDRFSIEGARTALKKLRKEVKKTSTITNAVSEFESVRDELHTLISCIQKTREIFKKNLT